MGTHSVDSVWCIERTTERMTPCLSLSLCLLTLCLFPGIRGLNVLFIGNSYTYYNELPDMVRKLAKADGKTLFVDSHTEGGWTWKKHSESQKTRDKITSRVWDVVVLQEYSTYLAHDTEIVCTNSVPYLNSLVELIRSVSPKATLQFYLSWGRPYGESSLCPSEPQYCQFDSMQDSLTLTYTTLACMNKPARAAPVGEAFRLVKQTQGDAVFHSLYKTGDHHPSLSGSYLAGLLHYLGLFNTSVLGNTETLGLDPETVKMLQVQADMVWGGGEPWEFSAQENCDLCICNCQK